MRLDITKLDHKLSVAGQVSIDHINEIAAACMIVFLGLESLSISIYVLVGFLRTSIMYNESALKYFLLGAFSSGFLLFGIAFIYGATGTTRLPAIARHREHAASHLQPAGAGRHGSAPRRVRLQGSPGALQHVDP